MSTFWSIFIVAMVVINLAGCIWLLILTTRVHTDEDGSQTTHVWDEDLTEYNNPLPRWWLNLFYLTIVFSVIYLILFPGLGNFAGILGWTQTGAWQEEVAAAEEKFGPIFAAFADTPLEELANDETAVNLGRNLFANNCAACHGSDARGALGFPDLTDGAWIYGGDAQTIQTSIAQGRTGVMPALGTALGEQGIDEVVAYLRDASGLEAGDADTVAAGQQKYMTFCIACHGPDAKGVQAVGGPDLTDAYWLHGSQPEAIRDVIVNGRVNQMPAQLELLGEDRIRVLAAYVLSLSAAAR